MLRAVAQVEGWLHATEAAALFESVRERLAEHRPCVVVEIGSWKGRSTVALACAIREPPNGQVFAIDPHTGSKEHIGDGVKIDTFPDFLANVEKHGVSALVKTLRMTSHEGRARFADHSVDVLFVDGSHEYEDVRLDITDWTTTLRDGSIAAFNDVFWPGVYKALNETVTRIGSKYRSPRLVRNTLLFDFKPNAEWTLNDSYGLLKLRILMFARRHLRRIRRVLPEWLVDWGHRASETWIKGLRA